MIAGGKATYRNSSKPCNSKSSNVRPLEAALVWTSVPEVKLLECLQVRLVLSEIIPLHSLNDFIGLSHPRDTRKYLFHREFV